MPVVHREDRPVYLTLIDQSNYGEAIISSFSIYASGLPEMLPHHDIRLYTIVLCRLLSSFIHLSRLSLQLVLALRLRHVFWVALVSAA